jgi:hypothetical protein
VPAGLRERHAARPPGVFSRLRYYLLAEGGGNGTGTRAAPAGELMLGHSHALSGGVAGLAAGIFLHLPIPQTAAPGPVGP